MSTATKKKLLTLKPKRTGPYVRPSRAKPKKTRTCPICAETFKSTRSDQKFCSGICRKRATRGSIPEAVAKQAEEIRAKRTETQRKAAEKRQRERERKEAQRQRQREQDEKDAPLRSKWVASIEKDFTAQIAKEPAEFHDELRLIMAEQIERAKAIPIPTGIRKILESE